ncbi:PucR family transcriptional regulator [Fictibacillus gelatini]|uniref:PucR family transcriptional regulator n=1 Tax=Fictibacillus gelatini TaxID=225985 RepID=UPI000400F018|nr:PucR family transcriptional regulator [Fictibacillus gelatini]
MNDAPQGYDPFRGTFENLETLADKISDVLNCPVTIEDSNHRLLSYSTHEGDTDPARIATIIGRRVPEKVINSLWKDGVIPKLQESDEPVRASSIEKVGLGNRVAVSIRKDSEVLGYIWVLEMNKHLTESDFELLKKAAKAAKSHLLQLQTGTKRKQEGSQEFFWKLLTGHVESEEWIIDKLHRLSILPSTPLTVLIFQFPEEINSEFEKKISYITTVNQSVKAQLSAVDGNQVILLTSPKEDAKPAAYIQSFIESFISQMKERFQATGITAGYGSIYSSYMQTEKSYKEALTVLSIKSKFANETSAIFGYNELGIYQFLDSIYKKQQASGYFNHSLKKLYDYDRLHKTNLYETLETFLNHDMNAHEAAKALHVHLNTLTYRLKRISEIGAIDLKDPNQKIMLFIDLKIQRLFFKEHL